MRKSLLYFSLFAVLALFLFKPITLYTVETYLSSLLKTEVKVTKSALFKGELQTSIKDKNNLASIKINTFFPFQADFAYKGNVDAFAVYHPVKGLAELQGKLYYKDVLKLRAELNAFGANALVEVKGLAEDLEVLGNIFHFDLRTFKDENNLPVDLSGSVDGEIEFHTSQDSTISLTSESVTLQNNEIENIRVQLSKTEEDIYAWTTFEAKDIEYKGAWFHYDENRSRFDGKLDLQAKGSKRELIINLEGEHKDTVILAKADANIGDSRIDINDLVYDNNSSEASAVFQIDLVALEKNTYISDLLGISLQGDFSAKGRAEYKAGSLKADVTTQSLGGDLALSLDEGRIKWKAEDVELAKLLYLVKLDEKISASLNTKGVFTNNNIDAQISTKKLTVGKEEIKNLAIAAKGPLNRLEGKLHLDTPYANIEDSAIRLADLSRFDLDANVTTPYTSEDISVRAKALYSNGQGSLELNATSAELSLSFLDVGYAQGRLDGNYTAAIESGLSGLKNRLRLEGEFSYDEVFEAKMKMQDLGGTLEASLHGTSFKANASAIDLKVLLENLHQAPYASGSFDLKAQGSLESIDFGLSAQRLSLNKNETGMDENISCKIKARINTKELVLWPNINNRYLDIQKGTVHFSFEDKSLYLSLPLKLRKDGLEFLVVSKANVQDDIRADLYLSHKDDRLRLNKLTYKEQHLQTEIALDIKELEVYKNISGQKLHGPFSLQGKARYEDGKPYVYLNSDSLGGRSDLRLEDKELQVRLDDISHTKLERLLRENSVISKKGLIDANADYDLMKKSGQINVSGRDLEFRGIDLDKTIQGYQDILGLDIFAIGKNILSKDWIRSDDAALVTTIDQLQVDLDITPDLIVSKDLALATKNFRFAANAQLKHDGEIKACEIAIIDYRGCAVLRQRLKGNISSPELVNTSGAAVTILGSVPSKVLGTGGKILKAGTGIIDSGADFIWKKALRQDSNVTLISDTLTEGYNVLSAGKDIVVSGKCELFYKGKVKHPK